MKMHLVLVLGLCGAASAFGQDNDFLTDYSLLEPLDGNFITSRYFAPNVVQRLADYDAILVDQP